MCPEYFVTYVSGRDVDRVLDDLDMPYRLSEVPFEGITVVLPRRVPRQQSIRHRFLITDADFYDVIFVTGGTNVTHTVNGSEWYFSNHYP
jgi:molybdopterin biosynthesis enzyme MoaB